MTSHLSYMRYVVLLAGAVGLGGCDSGAAPTAAAPPPPSVAVAKVQSATVPLSFQYAGRVAAFREVEIRARVQGILKEKTFVEGSSVKAGEVLFKIDPAPYEAELARARAQLMEAKAQLGRTERDLERASTLFQRQHGTEKARDDALSAHELAKAAVAGAEAQVRTAEINLGYTTITAPIAGVTSLRVQAEGSLVGVAGSDTLLTRISQLDPVYVHFSFVDSEATEIRRLLNSGEGEGPADGKLRARIVFGNGESFGETGIVDFIDTSLDLQTGTLRARAVFANPDSKLRPGEFVRVFVEGVSRHHSIVVPQVAVMQGAQGPYVYVVGEDNKANVRPVTIGREVGQAWIIPKGLEDGDKIITEGLIKVRPGSTVTIAATTGGKTAEADPR